MHCFLYRCMCMVLLTKNCFLYTINNTTTKLTHSCQSSATRFKIPHCNTKKTIKIKQKNVASNSLSEDWKSLFLYYIHECNRNVKIQNLVTIWHVGLKKKVLYINSDEPSVTQIKKKKPTLTDPPFQTFQEMIIYHGGKTSYKKRHSCFKPVPSSVLLMLHHCIQYQTSQVPPSLKMYFLNPQRNYWTAIWSQNFGNIQHCIFVGPTMLHTELNLQSNDT
jgi:hypothetical protein